MDFTYLHKLRRTHAAWRLLAAESAPLVVSFFHFAFVETNIRSMSETELQEKFKDYLLHIRSSYGEELFPRSAADYLEEWSDQEHNWLRKYYP